MSSIHVNKGRKPGAQFLTLALVFFGQWVCLFAQTSTGQQFCRPDFSSPLSLTYYVQEDIQVGSVFAELPLPVCIGTPLDPSKSPIPGVPFQLEQGLLVSTTKPLDAETEALYNFTVSFCDSPDVDHLVTVVVENVNDEPPKFDQQAYRITVVEGLLPLTTIGIFTANDPDTDQRDLRYSLQKIAITQYPLDQYLAIDVFGRLFIKKKMWVSDLRQDKVLSGQDLQFYFFIQASDGTFGATTRIVVEMLLASQLQTDRVTETVNVQENLPVGTFVSNLRDILNMQQTELVVSQESEIDLFGVDEDSGNVTTKAVFDRESRPMYSVLLNIGVCSTRFQVTLVLEIMITDVNDNSPEFIPSSYTCKVPESSTQLYGLIVAISDKDADQNSEAQLYFDSPFSKVFRALAIPTESVYNGFEVDVVQPNVLDFEKSPRLFVNMTAEDTLSSSLYATAELLLILSDENDNPPVFTNSTYNLVVLFDFPIGDVITTVTATDGDMGDNSLITYDLFPGCDGKISIDSFSGDLSLVDNLTPGEILQFDILARDNGLPQLTSTAQVTITVQNLPGMVNGTVEVQFDQPYYSESVSEQSSISNGILQVTARIVRGRLDNDVILYSIGNFELGDATKIEISELSGVIAFTSPVDFETPSERHYVFSVIATSSLFPSVSTNATVFIQVINANDEAPIFTSSYYFALHNLSAGPLLYVLARDRDIRGSFPSLVYMLEALPISLPIDIDRATGLISLSLDIPTQNSTIEFNVTVTDGPHTDTTTVEVIFGDWGSTACGDLALSLAENTTVGELQYRIADPQFNATLSGPSDYFTVSQNGNLELLKPLDREMISSFEANIITDDQQCLVSISVIDNNDSPTRCIQPFYALVVPGSQTTATSVSGQSLGFVDEDLVTASREIIVEPKEIGQVFSVSSTGVVSLIAARNVLHQPLYEFTVTVRETETSLEGSCLLRVQVEGLPPLRLSKASDSVMVSEAKSVGSLIYTVKVVYDEDLYGISYGLTAGNFGSTYMKYIDILNNGEVYLIGNLDAEVDKSFQVEVEVEVSLFSNPQAVTQAYLTLTVEVEAYNDNPPIFNQSSYYVSITKELKRGDVILEVHADDPDGQTVNYGIEDCGLDLFGINQGKIFLNTVPSRQYFPNVSFVVTATDTDVFPRTSRALVTVTVPSFNSFPPEFLLPQYTTSNVSVEEGRNNSYVTRVQAIDQDSDIIQYELPDSVYSEYFRILQNGEIYVVSPLDRDSLIDDPESTSRRKREVPLCRSEDRYVIPLPVIAIDNGNPSRTASTCVLIIIRDINDNRPRFSVNETTVYLPWNFQLGSKPDSNPVVALDLDDADNGEVIYHVTSKSEYFTVDPETGIIEAKKSCGDECKRNEEYELEKVTIYANNKDDIFSMSNEEDQFLTVRVVLQCVENCGLSTLEIVTICLSCVLGVFAIVLVVVIVTQYKKHQSLVRGIDERNKRKLRRYMDSTSGEYTTPDDSAYRSSYLTAESGPSTGSSHVDYDNNPGHVDPDSGYQLPKASRPFTPYSRSLDDINVSSRRKDIIEAYPRPSRRRGVPLMTNFGELNGKNYGKPF